MPALSLPIERPPPETRTMEPPLPISATSSSTSSQPIFDWPRATPPPARPDPFDTFDPVSSAASPPSPEDDSVPHNVRRASHHRSATDPLLRDGQPIDTEFTSGLPVQEYSFNPPPVLNRTFSSPLPARVGYLRHPLSPNSHKHALKQVSKSFPSLPPTPLNSISAELADSLQSAIQTLLRLSPPHLLDNAKEQYSGCSVQIPATSLSALLTSMKSLNYLSAHAEELFEPGPGQDPSLRKSEDFDVGELLQGVADMLTGEAAEKRIDFVLFHGDVGIKHVSVKGDNEGLAFVLGHTMRQILAVASHGDTIELGLQVVPQSPSLSLTVDQPLTVDDVDRQRHLGSGSTSRSTSPGRTSPLPPAQHEQGPLLCTFEIVHNISQCASESAAVTPKAEFNPFTHLAEETDALKPNLASGFLKRVLQRQNAVLKIDTQPPSPLGSGMPRRAYELSVLLPRGKSTIEPSPLSLEEEAARQPFSSVKLPPEPTLNELSSFADSLRGRKVFLYANLSSIFARHLTSYLAAWGMDISHVPTDGDEAVDKALRHDSGYGGSSKTTPGGELPYSSLPPNVALGHRGHFVIVDDDVAVLRRELLRIRAEQVPLSIRPRSLKRPTLAGRTRSSPSIRQAGPKPSGAVLIHFTSLANYNLVRDVITGFMGSPSSTGSGAYVQPEVMVIPKPIGPRRFLTALHTAVNQPLIDPFFSPIATSPRSPGGEYFGGLRTPSERESGFFDSVAEEPHEEFVFERGSMIKGRSPLGEYPPSAAQIVRTDHGLHLSLPTPGEIVATPAQEYFSSASKSPSGGGGHGASGVVMQSPDGRPFGMFFEPPVKGERRTSTHRIPSDSIRRIQGIRRASASDELSKPPGPPQPRRSSTVSAAAAEDRRHSIGAVNVEERPTHARMSSRRRNNLPAAEEPIVAIGRAKRRNRSDTVTMMSGSARTTPSGTPAATPPPAEEKEVEEEEKKKAPKASTTQNKKNAKADVIVPPINVLIVEDNPINQNILSMFLRKKKIKNQSAKDGAEAVEKWRTGGFHLILMDIQLPVMDGIAATKEIRRLERYNNIGVFPSTPVVEHTKDSLTETPAPSSPFRSSVIIVALTASSLQSDRVAALAAGCNDFLTKPVSLKWLDKKIVEWGCMQALIDFDGWRRWKTSDNQNETRQGFTFGPQQAAKSLASRLRIERKHSRSPVIRPASLTPEVTVQAPTPDLSETPMDSQSQTPKPPIGASASSPTSFSASVNEAFEQADHELEKVRKEQGLTNPGGSDSTGSTVTVMSSEKPLPPLPPQ